MDEGAMERTAGGARIGIILPSGGTEPEYYEAVERSSPVARLVLVISRSGGDKGAGDHAVDSLLETARIDYLEDAARRLARIGVDSVMWACTSGSFVIGLERAREQAAAIARAANVPASSTSLAFADALQRLGLSRAAVVSPYPRDATELFLEFVRRCGVEVVGSRRLENPSGWDSALYDQRRLVAICKATDTPASEALVVPDTALPTLDILAELEESLSKPVLTANQVTLWQAFRLAGAPPPSTLGCLSRLELSRAKA
jgi:maleate cis-trans isomerase